jgi:hypothetical protein
VGPLNPNGPFNPVAVMDPETSCPTLPPSGLEPVMPVKFPLKSRLMLLACATDAAAKASARMMDAQIPRTQFIFAP